MISKPSVPTRIISLVPSQTELLVDLGIENAIVGITKFCIHPAHLRKTKTIIGGTKNFNFSLIDKLQPDLILGNKEENYKEGIEQLQEKYRVWISDIENLPDALTMIAKVGELTDTNELAIALVKKIQTQFYALKPISKPIKVAYFIWREPYMVAASGTFIHHMLACCGFTNVFAHLTRYPQVTPEQVIHARPDILFLSSEPYPFQEKYFQEFKNICPETRIQLVNGEMFSWYGSRLLKSAGYFEKLINTIAITHK